MRGAPFSVGADVRGACCDCGGVDCSTGLEPWAVSGDQPADDVFDIDKRHGSTDVKFGG